VRQKKKLLPQFRALKFAGPISKMPLSLCELTIKRFVGFSQWQSQTKIPVRYIGCWPYRRMIFEVQCKPGAIQKVADALSRLPTDGLTMVEQETHGEEIPTLAIDVDLPGPPSTPCSVLLPEPLNAVTLVEVLKTQKHDKWCSELRS
jgi:hypothetical protein